MTKDRVLEKPAFGLLSKPNLGRMIEGSTNATKLHIVQKFSGQSVLVNKYTTCINVFIMSEVCCKFHIHAHVMRMIFQMLKITDAI